MAELKFRAPGCNYSVAGPADYVEIQGKYLCVVDGELAILDAPPAKPKVEAAPAPVPAPKPNGNGKNGKKNGDAPAA